MISEEWDEYKTALSELAALPGAPETEEMEPLQVASRESVENFEPLQERTSFSVKDEPRPSSEVKFLPSDPYADGPPLPSLVPKSRGFDFGRALTAFGGGDVGAYDARQSAIENEPYVAARRRQEMADAEEIRSEKRRQRQLALARLDPQSPESQAAQREYADQLASYQKIPGIPEGIKAELANAQGKSQTMSATQIDAAFSKIKDLLGVSLKGAGVIATERLGEKKMALAEEAAGRASQTASAQISNMAADNALQREKFEYEKNKPIKLKMPGENTLKDYRQRQTIINQTKEAIALLPQVRYTGYGAETANQVMSQLPGGLDKRNDAERKLSTILSTLRAAARNKLFGAALSKYDIKDANSFLANLGNNKETLATNLNIALRALQDMNEMTEEQYPSISGEPMPGAKKESTGAIETPPEPWPNAKPGERKRDKETGITWEVQPDGSLQKVK